MGDSGLLSRATRLVIGRGLVSAADIHRVGIRARDLSQSNSVVLVECGDGRGYVVKDMRRRREETQGSPAIELAIYRAVHQAVQRTADERQAEEREALRELVPRFLHFDDERQVMILEGLLTARRLDQSDGGRRALDPEVAGWLGRALGQWHREAVALGSEIEVADPWMLDIDGAKRLPILDSDEGLREIVEKIMADEATAKIPAQVRRAWRSETVIHGDVRFANVLVNTSPPAVRFIDWETGGLGDPAWDVGAAVQEYLSVAVSSGHRTAAGSPAEPPIEALLAAYQEASDTEMPWPRLAPFVACRLLMRAIQLANWEGDPGEAIDIHLQLAGAVAAEGEGVFDAADGESSA